LDINNPWFKKLTRVSRHANSSSKPRREFSYDYFE
jgi:hypothetical protein